MMAKVGHLRSLEEHITATVKKSIDLTGSDPLVVHFTAKDY
jgi:hypothetical protein